MNQVEKINRIVSLVALSIASLSLKFGTSLFLISSLLVLVRQSVVSRSRTPILALSYVAVFLFPQLRLSTLYGRDSYDTAFNAVKISDMGWPLPEEALEIFNVSTPLMHIHAIIAGQITNLELVPDPSYSYLITSILPIFYSGLVIIVTISIVDRYYARSEAISTKNISLLPLLFYVPFVEFHTGFRRQSMGLALFVMVVYLSLSILKQFDRRKWLLLVGICIVSILAHNFSSYMVLVYLSAITVSLLISRSTRVRYEYRYTSFVLLAILQFILFLGLRFVGGLGGDHILGTITAFSLARMGDILVFVNPSNTIRFPHTIDRGFVTLFRDFFSQWLYQLVIGSSITALGIYEYYQEEVNIYTLISFIFGVIIAVGALIAYLTGIIDFVRVFVFFICACGWISIGGLKKIPTLMPKAVSVSEHSAVTIGVLLILLLGSAMVPPHVVTTSAPNYQEGEFSQRYTESISSSSMFISDYIPKSTIIGDTNIREVVSSRTGYPVIGRHQTILTGDLQSDKYAVLGHWNTELYQATNRRHGRWLTINPPLGLFSRFDENNDRVYDNGNVTIYRG